MMDDAVRSARQEYVTAHPTSAALHRQAAAVMPGGNTRTVLFNAPFPIRVARGWGCRIEDVDGFTYVDLLGEYTAGLFGHSNPAILDAIRTALDAGLSLGAHNTYEPRLAAALVDRFRSIELIRFTNSGTEANLMAVSLARHVTGRDAICVVRGGYHGGFMYYGGKGSPLNVPFDTVLIDLNDVDASRAALRENADRLAAIVVEAVLGSGGCISATPEFLHMLRDEATRAGILLVLDEVMTSRLAPGGAQQLYDVTPDLTTLGKYLGGGLSFGAFGGRADLMSLFDPTRPDALQHAGTFNNNVLSMAAGTAAVTEVLTAEALRGLNDRGEDLRERLNAVFASAAVPLVATGMGSMINIHPVAGPVRTVADLAGADDRVRELLFLDLLAQGYYIARRGFIALSLAITDAEVDGAVAAVESFVGRYRHLLGSG